MELYIPIEKPQRNIINGRFLKGCTPHNKGKKWDEIYSKSAQEKMLKAGLPNLKGRSDIAGWNAKKIVGIVEWQFSIFSSIQEAERKTGICASAISRCCRKKRKHAGNAMWFYEDDNEWIGLCLNS